MAVVAATEFHQVAAAVQRLTVNCRRVARTRAADDSRKDRPCHQRDLWCIHIALLVVVGIAEPGAAMLL
jgi:hypothetical protein